MGFYSVCFIALFNGQHFSTHFIQIEILLDKKSIWKTRLDYLFFVVVIVAAAGKSNNLLTTSLCALELLVLNVYTITIKFELYV